MLEDLFKVVKFRAENDNRTDKKAKVSIPDNLLFKCPRCGNVMFMDDFSGAQKVCAECSYHARLTVSERMDMTIDPDSFVEYDETMKSLNPIEFEGYEEKLAEMMEKTGLNDAIVTGECTIRSKPCVIGVMDSRFMMASMGSVVGEKITRAFERATEKNLPVVLFTASGGARMQEGIVSLMQMAKTSAAVALHSEKGLLYITVLTDPTTGGVTASFASLGDIIIAEPKVLIGFAGRRVIEGTIKQRLPNDFQSAEFLLDHGFADMIVHRKNLRKTISKLIRLNVPAVSHDDFTTINNTSSFLEIPSIPAKMLSASERLSIIRGKNRPTINDYIPIIFDEFCELHGDRLYGDDHAILGGVASFKGMPVTVIAEVKGHTLEENKRSNFAMPHPEGYRKALRLCHQAEKFKRPVIFFIDTPGAFCGVAAEERGQGEAIARNLLELSRLKTPIISIVLGEGGSGGALALGICDSLAMLQNSIYSVISPRGFASILWKDATKEKEAADILKITAEDLTALGICDETILEPVGGSQNNPQQTAENISQYIDNEIKNLMQKDIALLLQNRYNKFRKIGAFSQ